MIAKPERTIPAKAALPLARNNDIVIQETGNEILIYDLKSNRANSLNETAALVWNHCDGSKTAKEISEEISVQMKTPVSEELVWLTLDQLNENKLLKTDLSAHKYFGDASRRELIKKVGLGSMIALPLISSIIAPKAITAQSACIPINVCLPPGTNLCPAACNGRSLGVTTYSSTNGSCTNSVIAQGITCGAAPVIISTDHEVSTIV